MAPRVVRRRRPARSAGLLLVPLLARGVAAGDPSLEASRQPRRDRFVYQGFNGATVKIDRAQLARDQAAAGWTEEEEPGEAGGPTYSVVVVQWR